LEKDAGMNKEMYMNASGLISANSGEISKQPIEKEIKAVLQRIRGSRFKQ